MKPCKGKTWSRTISLFVFRFRHYVDEGNSSLKSFMVCVDDDLREREAVEFGKVLIVR